MAKTKNADSSIGSMMDRPTLYVTEKDVPQLKSWDIDKTYTLEVKATLKSLSKDEYGDSNTLRGSFTVTNIKSDDDDPGMSGFDSYKGDREKPKRG